MNVTKAIRSPSQHTFSVCVCVWVYCCCLESKFLLPRDSNVLILTCETQWLTNGMANHRNNAFTTLILTFKLNWIESFIRRCERIYTLPLLHNMKNDNNTTNNNNSNHMHEHTKMWKRTRRWMWMGNFSDLSTWVCQVSGKQQGTCLIFAYEPTYFITLINS